MSLEKRLAFNLESVSIGNSLRQQFACDVLDRGLIEFRAYYVESEENIAAALAAAGATGVVRHYRDIRDSADEKYYIDNGDILIYISHFSEYNFTIDIAAATAEEADATARCFVKALPTIKHTDPDTVPVTFWAQTRRGVISRTRKIGASAWDDISVNYAEKARGGLAAVMGLTPPMDAGKLLLWHGEPGTGKSYGIRSLMREWRKWCRPHYIVDPEKFFGEADYMLSVILDQTSDDEECEAPIAVAGDPKVSIEAKHPWHLLVMEDADEFLQADAKVRQGQALSRLLNMADGLIGQGLNLLVLITTNEPLAKIHPAIQREGRCMVNIEFGKLAANEVMEWALEHKLSPDDVPTMLGGDGGALLSDLYAKSRTQAQVKTTVDKRKMGLVR